MRRYWRIYRVFARSSIQRELEFRANFFAKVLQNVIWSFFFIAVLAVIYSKTKTVGGWNQGEALLLAGSIFIIDATMRAFFWSLIEIPENVRKGTLDFVVTKPVDSQFWVSTRKFDFGQLGPLIAGIVVVFVGAVQAELHPGLNDILAYVALMGAAIALFYSINFIMMTLGIYWVRVDNLWVLSDTMMGVARFPIDIYSLGIQKLLTYGLPLAFLAHFPASQLRTGVAPLIVLGGLVWSAALLMVSRLFWRHALRSYGSASS